MYNFLIPSLLAAFGWGVNPLFDRYAMKFLDKYSYIVIRLITTGVIGLIGLIIVLRKNTKLKYEFNNLKKNIFGFNPIYCGILTAIIWCIGPILLFCSCVKSNSSAKRSAEQVNICPSYFCLA